MGRGDLTECVLQFIHNAAWVDGLGGSVAVGVGALPDDADGALIVPGDMPFLTPEFLNAMIERFASAPAPRPILFPQLPDGTQGNPVLWPKRFFPELAKLTGAVGAKPLIKRYAAEAQAYAVPDARLLIDVDTPDDLERARRLKLVSDTPGQTP
jgi:molybdenum cofactor cytidylyltransferase